MKHEVSWDAEHGCVRFTVHGPLVVDEARAMTEELERILEGKPRRHLLVDHRGSPGALPVETRRFFQTDAPQLDKLAFFGMSNLNRIAARIAVSITGQAGHTNFFKTEADALAWLAKPET
ncbi:MAG: STAS/SEC14 domain-containing protein [Myxococcales bacterium]|nr:STAS/SEC14 domain-containing protein [Myxococcales bacterium]MCB9749010.1 STAS/SEC14 domain-containing protein [Myxococcales bacterium]